ncbi:MAG: integrase arm-type DNA-binding domain-containing protein [Alphaproteobacteria bacterium]|nr:integrase arm-type DNA-binding domain-containing protein [Alphaproteobacteria bacterium]
MKLTDTAVRNAKPKEKTYKLFDGAGVYLEVTPKGGKLWRLKYYYLGKEKRISLGPYPLVTLAQAREKRDAAKKDLLKNIDPSAAKQEHRQEIIRNAANTFEAIAHEWHKLKKDSGWSEAHAANVMRRLEMDVFPYIGKRPLSGIDAPEILGTLRKIETRGALEIAARIRGLCGQIFRYGIQTGRCANNPIPDLAGALKTKKTAHFAALDSKEIPELLHAIERNDQRLFGGTRRAILFNLLTFVRPGELRYAKWEEFNFNEKLWTIPAERMKMRRPHLVPLSKQAITLLEEQREEYKYLKTPWVFPSPIRPKDPMSDGAVLMALKRLGFKGRMTAHGFRALARTTIREKLDYDPDVIEAQLAHKAAGPLGEAYNRAQHLTKRKQMMQEWANYIDDQANRGKIIKGRFRREVS